jgi:hypothetical protein
MTHATPVWLCTAIAIALVGAAIGAASGVPLFAGQARVWVAGDLVALSAVTWLIVLAAAFVVIRAKAVWLLITIPLVMLGPLELLGSFAGCTISVRSCTQAMHANPGR